MGHDYAINERVAFMGIDDKARAALRDLRPVIVEAIGPALARFYAKVAVTPQTRKFFEGEAHVASASARQQAHWGEIAKGEFSETYARAVRAIGETHARIGLEPRWYIGGYAMVSDHLIRAVIDSLWPKGFLSKGGAAEAGEAVSALMKAALLDMDFAISIYLETIDKERQRLEAERREAQARQQRLVEALGAALDRMARGDLLARLDIDVQSEFQKLKDDFNNAAALPPHPARQPGEPDPAPIAGSAESGPAGAGGAAGRRSPGSAHPAAYRAARPGHPGGAPDPEGALLPAPAQSAAHRALAPLRNSPEPPDLQRPHPAK